MRSFRLITSLALASLITVYACAVDPEPGASKDTSDVSLPGSPEAPSASPSETSTDEVLGTTTDAVMTQATCSVTLNFCDGAGAIGTDCKESGCSLTQAISACRSIVSNVGCAEHCNAVMRNSAGTIISTWRVTCGGRCCPVAPQGFCGLNGVCCDGIHSNGSCPPL